MNKVHCRWAAVVSLLVVALGMATKPRLASARAGSSLQAVKVLVVSRVPSDLDVVKEAGASGVTYEYRASLPPDFQSYAAVVLTSPRELNQQQAIDLENYVHRGGGVIATMGTVEKATGGNSIFGRVQRPWMGITALAYESLLSDGTMAVHLPENVLDAKFTNDTVLKLRTQQDDRPWGIAGFGGGGQELASVTGTFRDGGNAAFIYKYEDGRGRFFFQTALSPAKSNSYPELRKTLAAGLRWVTTRQ